jgi:hypothetical protein
MIAAPSAFIIKTKTGESELSCPVCNLMTKHELFRVETQQNKALLGNETKCSSCGLIRLADDPVEKLAETRHALAGYAISRMTFAHSLDGNLGCLGTILFVAVVLFLPLVLIRLILLILGDIDAWGLLIIPIWLLQIILCFQWLIRRSEKKFVSKVVQPLWGKTVSNEAPGDHASCYENVLAMCATAGIKPASFLQILLLGKQSFKLPPQNT